MHDKTNNKKAKRLKAAREMAKAKSPTFIHELKLQATQAQIKTLDKRLDVARQLYNACLGEALRRLWLLRQSKLYQKARLLSKKVKNARGKLISNKERQALFKEARIKYQFQGDYDLHDYVKILRKDTWLGEHIDSSTAQAIATRAFDAVMAYAVGKKGKPRYRTKWRFSSIDGKSNSAGMRYLNGQFVWGKGFEIPLYYDHKDKYGLEAYALSCRTKYVRIVRRIIKGNSVWYLQLVQEGKPYLKEKHLISDIEAADDSDNIVGLDIGPSTIAIVSKDKAILQAFCPEVDDYSNDIKALGRNMSRSLRLMNPDNYEKDQISIKLTGKKHKKCGKVLAGPRKWIKSNHYKKMQYELLELNRKSSTTRKCAHNKLTNTIFSYGKIIQTEKLSYKGLQKIYGKSVGRRAPGLFMKLLRYKAEKAGGQVIEFNTRTTALSQYCHCGNKAKKALKDRWHECSKCGIKAQRDLYSAYLACFVQKDRLDTSQAHAAWAGAGILLEQAVSNLKQTTNSKTRLASFGLGQRLSGSSVKKGMMQHKVLDVVT